MIEFQHHLLFYQDYWYKHFSKEVPENIWGDLKQAELFLSKYWLSNREFEEKYEQLFLSVFPKQGLCPDFKINSQFQIILTIGGCLFSSEDYTHLTKALLDIGETEIIILQNESFQNEPLFRMKFPVGLPWNEIMSGNYISSVLVEMTMNEYYVFGMNPTWCKYSASDFETPIDIIGVHPDYNKIFSKYIHSIDYPDDIKALF